MIGKNYTTKRRVSLFRGVALLLFLVLANSIFAQEKTITGTVADKSGMVLPGVNVIIKGTTKGTVTDLDGKFSLRVPDNNAELLISFVGYENQEIKVNDQTTFSVVLTENVKEIDQIVVVGYGVQKKSDLTGAVASVSSEKLAKTPVTGLDQALQGMAAGVNIIPVTGRPGSGVNIQVRGISSINGTKPKIILDGVAQDDDALNRINPDDVESIEVLKDASSAAIYGASGGNGVIIVTTKKGKSGDIRVNYNAYMGIDNVIKKLDLMNSQQWVELVEEMSTSKKPFTTNPDTFKTYDWQDIFFREAISQNHDLSISGGSDKSTFLLSSSYSKEEGIIKNTDHQRFTLRLNSEHKINKYVTFEEKISYVNNVTKGFADWEYSGYYQNPVMAAYQMIPYQPAYKEDGTWTEPYGGVTNPMVGIDMKNNTMRSNNFEGNFSVNITPLKGLTYTSRFTQGLNFGDNKEYQAKYFASATNRRDQNALIQSMNRGLSWNVQNILTYTNTLFDSHNFSVMAGHEAGKWWGYDISGQRVDMPSDMDELLYLSMSTNDTLAKQVVEGSGYEGRSYRYFGRLNYDYKGKYLLTVNVSRDYHYSFGPANRGGTFPSFSVGWKFTEEEFVKNNISVLNFGKIRYGYGQTGANAKTGYPYLTTVKTPAKYMYAVNGTTASIGAGPEQIANPAIKWESINMTNVGLDLGFWDNKLTLSAEYFIKTNDGMIMQQQVPFTVGAYDMTLPEVNIGSIENRGFELTVGHKNTIGDLKYSMDFNISFIKNKIIDLATDSLLNGGVHVVSPITLTREGGAVSEYYGYKTNGLFRETDPMIAKVKGTKTTYIMANQTFFIKANGDTAYFQPIAQPGDVRYVDVNGDGIMDNKDKVSLGSPLPKFTFGFMVNLEYKMFDLNAFFNGSYGNKVFNGTKQYLYYAQGYGNRAAAFANRYKNEVVKDGVVVVHANKDTDIPRFNSDNYAKPSDFYVEDGSYIRLRSIQLGFTVPKSITQKMGIGRFKVYVGAKNLFTITNYSGVDPVVSGGTNVMAQGIDIGGYPATKTYLAGINLEF
ncbi:MAG TPA: TonB-dependent receptor [Bacteroidales bacterium]|nr:TonB-dependent receptor [Bacteroidales bacterium]